MKIHDPHYLALRRGIRVAIFLAPAFALSNNVLHLGSGALYTSFAVFSLTTFADYGGPLVRRAKAYLGAALAGVVLIAIGTAVTHSIWSAVIGSVLVTFVLFFAGVLRGYFVASAIPVLLPFVIAVTSGPVDIRTMLFNQLGWFIGAISALIAALVVWPAHPRRTMQKGLATALKSAARAIRAMFVAAGSPNTDAGQRIRELISANEDLHATYLGWLTRPGAANQQDRALIQLVDQVDRLKTLLKWELHAESETYVHDVELAETTATAIDQCADALLGRGPAPDPNDLDLARSRHREHIQNMAAQAVGRGDVESVVRRADSGWQIRALAGSAELACINTTLATGGKPVRQQGGSWTSNIVPKSTFDVRPGRLLLDNFTLSSPWMRNSLRAAAAVGMATALAAMTGVDHGFWVVLGAISALRFDAMGTGRNALQVVAGTIIGFLVSVAAVTIIGDEAGWYWVLLPIVAAFAAYAPGALSQLAGQAAFTLFVIVFFAIVLGPQFQTSEFRVIDVGLGLVASLIMSALLWPRGVNAQVVVGLRKAMQAATDCLLSACDAALEGPDFVKTAEEARVTAAAALARAEEAFDLALSQAGPRQLNIRAWSMISNCAGQLLMGSQIVTLMARLGLNDLRCPGVADTMLATTHHLRARMNRFLGQLESLDQGRVSIASDSTYFADHPTDDGMLGDPISRLRREVTKCVTSQAPGDSSDRGASIVRMIWIQDWLIHLDWVARRVERIRPVSPGAGQPGR
ncbi:MAG: FUSC family protein [Candidatus Nanopelagicales bacterium]|nr:FUSC family protein [Candidatus Nanopelagicales bacterium]